MIDYNFGKFSQKLFCNKFTIAGWAGYICIFSLISPLAHAGKFDSLIRTTARKVKVGVIEPSPSLLQFHKNGSERTQLVQSILQRGTHPLEIEPTWVPENIYHRRYDQLVYDQISSAYKDGTRIFNLSFGTGPSSSVILRNLSKINPALRESIIKEFRNRKKVWSQGFKDFPDALFIVSAGDHAQNNDSLPYFPATFSTEHDNVISVASHLNRHSPLNKFRYGEESEFYLAPFSNYGPQSVQIAALGQDLSVLDSTGHEIKKSGTAGATALVTRACAQILSTHPKLNALEIKKVLKQSAKRDPRLKAFVTWGGILDEDTAMKLAEYTRNHPHFLESLEDSDEPCKPYREEIIAQIELNSQTKISNLLENSRHAENTSQSPSDSPIPKSHSSALAQ